MFLLLTLAGNFYDDILNLIFYHTEEKLFGKFDRLQVDVTD